MKVKISSSKILKLSDVPNLKMNLDDSKNVQHGKFQKFSVWKIRIIFNLENSRTYPICKLQQICNLEHKKIINLVNSKNYQF